MSNHRLVAVAPADPLDKRTFSGLSANLFGEIRRQGVAVDPVATRDLRWHDALRGAVELAELFRPQSRKASRINPSWFWSRSASELMTRRFETRLAALPSDSVVLQVGTHARAKRAARRIFCITDATVAQALHYGRTYQVGRASKTSQQEAVSWQKEVFEECERIFVLSDWVRDSVVSDYGIAREKVITVGAGANVPSNLPARRRNDSTPTVLFVGLDWEQKGGPLLLRAFRLVRAKLPNARLLVIGCRPASLEGEPGVEVLGRLNRSVEKEEQLLLQAYAEAACFCIAPAVDAFPNVLLEASAFGLPVVSTDIGSRREAVVDRVTGRLVPHDDHEALAAALLEILSDPSTADKYGLAASQLVKEKLNWPHVVRTMLQHMRLSS